MLTAEVTASEGKKHENVLLDFHKQIHGCPINKKKCALLATVLFFQSEYVTHEQKQHVFCITLQVDASGNSLLSIVPLLRREHHWKYRQWSCRSRPAAISSHGMGRLNWLGCCDETPWNRGGGIQHAQRGPHVGMITLMTRVVTIIHHINMS